MIRYWLSIIAMVVAVLPCHATTFYTHRLERIASAVGLSGVSIDNGHDTLVVYHGCNLRVKSNFAGDICHIGYELFSELDFERIKNVALCNFIERYALELELSLDGRKPEARMDIDRIFISEGNWKMLKCISAGSLTDVEEINRRMYRLTWSIEGKRLSVVIPADCQLILGADAIELENMFERDVNRFPVNSPIDLSFENAMSSKSDSIRILERGHYLNELIRGDVYFTDKGGDLKVYCDARNNSRSISNIMLTGQFASSIPMKLTINKYGYKNSVVNTTVQQFIAYCVDEGCSLYFGIKTYGDKRLTGTLFVRNDALGYNHVLSVDFPTSIISGGDDTVDATLYAYIPLHNVTEKFFKQ